MNFSCTQEDLNDLYDMLSTCRPYESATEKMFLAEFLAPLGVHPDAFGNGILQVGPDDPKIIWSSHTDTVHRVHGIQKIVRDDKFNLKLSSKCASGCLGADDTAGVWLMTQMIKAKIPGLYIFHRGEEVGGLGSRWLVKNTPEMAKDIQACIAFDRRGVDSVITFQGGTRCCSEDFSKSMAEVLGGAVEDLKFKSDTGGSFTDSACYTDLVGECTNLSVGYYNQHMSSETLNLPHLIALREAMIKGDMTKLVFTRKPGEKEPKWKSTYDPDDYEGYSYRGHNSSYGHSYGARNFNHARSDHKYWESEFRGGYWEGMRWITCSRESWKLWVDKQDEARKKEAAKEAEKREKKEKKENKIVATSTAVPTIMAAEPAFDMDLLLVIRSSTIPLTRMLQDWGFDSKTILSMLEEYKGPIAKGAAAAKQVVQIEATTVPKTTETATN